MSELTVGQAVRAYREVRGLSARALSLAAGLSESYVTKLETGALEEPSLRAFARLVRELGMTSAEIVVLVTLEAGRSPRSPTNTGVDALEHLGLEDVLRDVPPIPPEFQSGGGTGQRPSDVLTL